MVQWIKKFEFADVVIKGSHWRAAIGGKSTGIILKKLQEVDKDFASLIPDKWNLIWFLLPHKNCSKDKLIKYEIRANKSKMYVGFKIERTEKKEYKKNPKSYAWTHFIELLDNNNFKNKFSELLERYECKYDIGENDSHRINNDKIEEIKKINNDDDCINLWVFKEFSKDNVLNQQEKTIDGIMTIFKDMRSVFSDVHSELTDRKIIGNSDEIKNETASTETDKLSNIINALSTKPFLILAGVSGTGKTQIARLVAGVTSKDK